MTRPKREVIGGDPVMGIEEIAKILPHRYPFLLVDRVVEIDLEADRIIAQKNVTANEEFFQGHFPDMPIMPGVLILEALAQAGGILFHSKGYTGKTAVLLNVKNAKFRLPVHPGDVLYLHVEAQLLGSKGGRVKAQAIVRDRVAADAEIGYAHVDRSRL